jgi:hypothetical protein
MNGPSQVSDHTQFDSRGLEKGRLASVYVDNISHTTVTFDYPYSEKYSRLKNDTTDPEGASQTKSEMEALVERICQEGIAAGMPSFQTEYAIRELLMNATQYAGTREPCEQITRVGIEWIVDANESDPCLILAISNPVPALFNPAKYSNTPFSELVGDDNQGHVNLLTLPGFVKPGTLLTYRWNTPAEETITCKLSYYNENDPDQPHLKEEATPSIRIAVSKSNNLGSTLPYSTEQFLQDVADRAPTTQVTARCVIGPSPKET